tara:strand:+ start:135 stop:269 length:135 start_codon:yes stop_codon:yes gene_type:complete
MDSKLIGLVIVLLGLLIFFSKNENAWIVSALLLGLGSGIFFWKK